jgi:hypothetical protein
VLRVPATILLAGSLASLALPRVAMAAPPSFRHSPPLAVPPRSEAPSVPAPSVEPDGVVVPSIEPPKSRGELEIGLGVLLTGTAVGLIAFGTVQLVRAREHVEFCEAEPIFIDELDDPSPIDPCVFDPPSLGFASAGLSWGFSAALLVGAGLLLARGGRLQAGARRGERRLSLSPWWNSSWRGGGGATLRWRF